MTDDTSSRAAPPASLEFLRQAVLAHPSFGAEQIRQRLAVDDDRPLQADLMILLAEAYQRQGQIRAALETIADAELLAGRLPPDNQRLLPMLAVTADLAVIDGRSSALPACHRYVEAATHVFRLCRRVLHADALCAVATYHHSDCVRGRAEVELLVRRLPIADSVAVMLRLGIAAMDNGCRPGCQTPPTTPIPALPGGLLRPDLGSPPADYLTSRVTRHSATHTCALASTSA